MHRLDDSHELPETPDDARESQYTGVIQNPWRRLREFTDARIGLGRTGISLPTNELLAFQLAHARAKDAVHMSLDICTLRNQLRGVQGLPHAIAPYHLKSQANNRAVYLQRPDLGRQLDPLSLHILVHNPATSHNSRHLAIVIIDGLSAQAVQLNTAPFLQALCGELIEDSQTDWQLNSVCIVEQGRVAIADDIGERIGADAVLVLIGERPGLSSPDSLGLYLTWGPRKGMNDAARNCISNIRPAGQSYSEAAQRTLYLLQEAQRLGLSGVKLKDRSESKVIDHQQHNSSNFLTN
jgi:ethanolamine ammonia-lyase small subunit